LSSWHKFTHNHQKEISFNCW